MACKNIVEEWDLQKQQQQQKIVGDTTDNEVSAFSTEKIV